MALEILGSDDPFSTRRYYESSPFDTEPRDPYDGPKPGRFHDYVPTVVEETAVNWNCLRHRRNQYKRSLRLFAFRQFPQHPVLGLKLFVQSLR